MEEQLFSVQHLVEECKKIEKNCHIKAQTHFFMARTAERQSLWLVIVPAAIAALAGFAGTANLLPAERPVVDAIAGLAAAIVAVSTIIGLDRRAAAQTQAGNTMMQLRHEARSLHETYWKELPRKDFFNEVRRINDRYGTLIQLLPIATERAFQEVRHMLPIYFTSEQSISLTAPANAIAADKELAENQIESR
jgi:hypothetical protein